MYRKKFAKFSLDYFFKKSTLILAIILPFILTAMLLELLKGAGLAINAFRAGFFFSSEWNPVTLEFGALNGVYGTIMTTFIAMIVAVPLSIGIALFLSEYCPNKLKNIFSIMVELLAAIPSIIYGMWGLFLIAPIMSDYVQPMIKNYLGFIPLFSGTSSGIGIFTAGLILALMILPFITMLMKETLELIPVVLKESALGLGSTIAEAYFKIIFSYAKRGFITASLLGLGRALGETMAITFVIGNAHHIQLSLFSPGTTIASTLANEFAEAVEPLYQSSLIYLAIVLFLISLSIQFLVHLWFKNMKKEVNLQ